MPLFSLLVHPSLRAEYDRMSLGHKILFLAVHGIDKLELWHRLPVILGVTYLAIRRTLHDKYNLLPVGKVNSAIPDPSAHPFRSDDGTFNDLSKPEAGSENTFFGRNVPPVDQLDKIMDPDPFVVATKLLERRSFIGTGKQFNVIAASWIQFMVHDWIDHLESTRQVELVAPKEVASGCPLKAFRFLATENIPTADGAEGIQTGHKNIRTSWWDGSVLYGSNKGVGNQVRTGIDGKLSIGEDGLLLHDEQGRAISGDIKNSWAGVSLLQALFAKEHNAVCDALKKEHPEFDDEKLFQHARLVTSAVIAKIHTIDWTVELLKTDTLNAAMHANWYGILGKTFKRIFGHIGGATLGPALSGLVGLKEPNDHGVPYSLTEEFTSVYRMHSLLPDTLQVRNINAPPGANKAPSLLKERLQADRFFTSHFNEKTYTKKGLEWVNKTESLKDVLNSHYPELTRKWMNSTSGFSVWDAPKEKSSWVPLYLRIPK